MISREAHKLLLDWRVDEHGAQEITLLPTRIDLQPYRTRILLGAQAKAVLTHVATLSAKLGAKTEVEEGFMRVLLDPGEPVDARVDDAGAPPVAH